MGDKTKGRKSRKSEAKKAEKSDVDKELVRCAVCNHVYKRTGIFCSCPKFLDHERVIALRGQEELKESLKKGALAASTNPGLAKAEARKMPEPPAK